MESYKLCTIKDCKAESVAIDPNRPDALSYRFLCAEHLMMNLRPNHVAIECINHPEWGSWGIYDDKDGWYTIHGNRGTRLLDKAEAVKFWKIATHLR
jgi:hypothetical protein